MSEELFGFVSDDNSDSIVPSEDLKCMMEAARRYVCATDGGRGCLRDRLGDFISGVLTHTQKSLKYLSNVQGVLDEGNLDLLGQDVDVLVAHCGETLDVSSIRDLSLYSASVLYRTFRQFVLLVRDYDGVSFKNGYLTVTQRSGVVLKDVNLGRFRISIDVGNVARGTGDWSYAYALNPVYASYGGKTYTDYTHPHIKHDVICVGSTATAIRDILCTGLVHSAIGMVDTMLRDYNPFDVHQSLGAWKGYYCVECYCAAESEDEFYTCEVCGALLCGGCVMYVGDDVFCSVCYAYSCKEENKDGKEKG